MPLRFMLTGLVALFFAAGWIIAKPALLASYHYNQYVIAATHLVVLGFICTVVMGAMYQLVPVALETKLYSERLAKWQFVIHVVGFIGMVWMFNASHRHRWIATWYVLQISGARMPDNTELRSGAT